MKTLKKVALKKETLLQISGGPVLPSCDTLAYATIKDTIRVAAPVTFVTYYCGK